VRAAVGGDPLDALLGAIAARPVPITDPLSWLLDRLAAAKGDDVFSTHSPRRSLIRALWLSDVVLYDADADFDRAYDARADAGYDDAEADKAFDLLQASGV
jgi:hypothetical protein